MIAILMLAGAALVALAILGADCPHFPEADEVY